MVGGRQTDYGRRAEIRGAVLERERKKCDKKKTKKGEQQSWWVDVGREAQTPQRERGRERKKGEEERGEPQADGLAEESSRGETEPKPTAVRTYYRKRNNGE